MFFITPCRPEMVGPSVRSLMQIKNKNKGIDYFIIAQNTYFISIFHSLFDRENSIVKVTSGTVVKSGDDPRSGIFRASRTVQSVLVSGEQPKKGQFIQSTSHFTFIFCFIYFLDFLLIQGWYQKSRTKNVLPTLRSPSGHFGSVKIYRVLDRSSADTRVLVCLGH